MYPLTGFARNLVNDGLVDETKVLEFIQAAKLHQRSLVNYLIEEKIVDSQVLAQVLSKTFSLPLLDLESFDTNFIPLSLIDQKLIFNYQVLPLIKRKDTLFLAIADPTQTEKINEVRFHTRLNIQLVLVELEKIRATIEDLTTGKISASIPFSEKTEDIQLISLDTVSEVENLDELSTNEAPLVRFIDKIIVDAINLKVSDIHFEPYEAYFRIRYRRDGLLYTVNELSPKLTSRFVARLKIMSQLDISERRVPQDGRFKIRLSDKRTMGFRINTCPTLFGEKVVLRILDPNSVSVPIDHLGFDETQKKLFQEAIQKPQGMILVTGPTGSGKTVTQYAALHILNQPEVNISTVEDPIEIYMGGVNQVNISSKTGLTFAAVLRAFLRQDPDIIMVGEIRDTETAEIALKAAQTGHLVLSTLHTNSSAETLTRLVNMGVEPFNIATSVKLVIAQRLIRKLCEQCKKKLEVPKSVLLSAGFTEEELPELQIYGPTGCHQCIKGYKGQTGIFELLQVTQPIEQVIMSNGNVRDINKLAREQGMKTLYQSGLAKVKQGITSLNELHSAITI